MLIYGYSYLICTLSIGNELITPVSELLVSGKENGRRDTSCEHR